MTATILQVIFPVFAIVLVGYLYGRRHRPAMEVANRLNMDLFIPALLFSALSGKGFELHNQGKLVLAGVLVVLLPGLAAPFVGRWLGYPFKTVAPPLMFNNSGNMGLPLALLAFGEPGFQVAVVLFMVENFLHFSVGVLIMEHRAHWKLLVQPLFLGASLGILVNLTGLQVPATVAQPIAMLGDIAIPLMLIALGVRLNEVDLSEWRAGLVGALARPLLGIAGGLLVIAAVPLSPLQQQGLLLFTALPPAVLNFLFAERYRQDPQIVAAIVLIGNLASLLAIPLALAWILSR